MLEHSLGKLTPRQQHHGDIPRVPNLRSLKGAPAANVGWSELLPLHFAFCLRLMFWGLLHSPTCPPRVGKPRIKHSVALPPLQSGTVQLKGEQACLSSWKN